MEYGGHCLRISVNTLKVDREHNGIGGQNVVDYSKWDFSQAKLSGIDLVTDLRDLPTTPLSGGSTFEP